MNALGTQIILELRECDRSLLNDLPFIRSTMLQAAQAVGATIVGESFHQFAPVGVSGVVAIAESHLCIHTWPEYGYAAVDIFTCGERTTPGAAAQLLIDSFRARAHSMKELQRGVLTDLVGAPGS